MKFVVKESLTDADVQSGLRAVIRDGMASQAMATLTSGAFLVAFALKLGASNLEIGLLAALPPLMQLLQIPSIYLVEKIKIRRAISTYASTIRRLPWLMIALIPFLSSPETGLVIILISAILLNSAFGAVSNCSWNSWMRDLITQERLGHFFSRRMKLSTGLGIGLCIAAAFCIDYWKRLFPDKEMYAYSFLFLVGFIAGMIGVYFISTIPEPRMSEGHEKINFLNMLVRPFEDINFRSLVMFLGSWNFAINLAAPFFTVYMLQRLGLEMSLIIGLTVLSQLMHFAFLGLWGKFTDRFSFKSVLGISRPLFVLCILAWAFTTMRERNILTVPLLIVIHIFMGISTADVNLASGNIGLKLAPKGYATVYLAGNNLVNSVAAAIAPILGGRFADFFASRELSMVLNWKSPGKELAIQTLNFQHWDFFFLFAFLIGLVAIYQLRKIKEQGEVEEKIAIKELLSEVRSDMRDLSSAGGLRKLVIFPFSIMRVLKKSMIQ